MAFTSNDDLNILQASDSQNIGAGAGNDTYIITPTTMAAGQTINITDIEGANSVKLVGGVTIESSKVAANSIQLTLNNGSIVNIFGADTFGYVLGGEAFDTNSGLSQTFTEFVEDSLGATVPTSGFVEGTTTGETIQDDGSIGTPATPTFALAANATGVDEGATATFTLTTTNVADGTTVNYTISGVSAADVTGGLTGTATVTGNTATISVPVVADTTTEGAETLTVSIDGQTGVTASTTVNDTSTTPVNTDPTFALAGPASVDEGATATYTLTTTNVAAGTSVAYTITGVDAADVTGGSLTGSVTVAADGTASIAVSLVEDSTTEGAETMTVSIDGQTGVTAATTVNDTSVLTTIPLTAGADTPTLTTGNDTIDGTTVVNSLNGDDKIVDSSTTDNDTLNVQLTNIIDNADGSAGDQPTITNIENVNIDWNRVGNANLDLKNVSGSTVTVKSTNADFIGGLTIDNVGASKLTASDKVTKITVNDLTTGTIDTGSATSASVSGTVATTDAPTLIVNGNISVTNNTSAGEAVENLTIQSSTAAVVTLNDIASGLTLTGDKDLTIKTANTTVLTGEKITDSTTAGTTTLQVAHNATTANFSKASVDLIDISADQQGATLTFKDSANVQISTNQTTAALILQGENSTDTLNVSTTSAVNSIVNLQTSPSLLESLLATINGNLTIDSLTSHATLTKIKGTGNLTVTQLEDASGDRVINATELSGKVTLKNVDNDDNVTIKTGGSDDSINVDNTTNAIGTANKTIEFEGNAGNDTFKLTSSFASNPLTADSIFKLNGGAGTDTLDLTGITGTNALVDFTDSTGASLTLTGFEKVKLNAGDTANNTGAVKFDAADITGATLSFTGATGDADEISIVGKTASADTIDLSGLVLDENVPGTFIDGLTGADTITGTLLTDTITADDEDSIDGGSGDDTVQFAASVSKSNLVDADLKNVENVVLTASADVDLSVQSEKLNITDSANADTIVGGSNADTISLATGGDDVLEYQIASFTSSNADTVTSFAVSGGDTIDFTDLTNSNLRGTGADLDTDGGTAGNGLAATTGLLTSSVQQANLNLSTAEAYLRTYEGATAASDLVANDKLFFAIDNGTDSALFYYEDSDGGADVDSGEVKLVLTFSGIAGAETLVAADFADFT